jgi:hypothetical protein
VLPAVPVLLLPEPELHPAATKSQLVNRNAGSFMVRIVRSSTGFGRPSGPRSTLAAISQFGAERK